VRPGGWFDVKGEKELDEVLGKMRKELTLTSEGGGFLDYLEAYLPRLTETTQGSAKRMFYSLAGKHSPFYANRRVEPVLQHGKPLDFDATMLGRIRAQSKEMYLYDALEDAVEHV
jgi:hypothetical protein